MKSVTAFIAACGSLVIAFLAAYKQMTTRLVSFVSLFHVKAISSSLTFVRLLAIDPKLNALCRSFLAEKELESTPGMSWLQKVGEVGSRYPRLSSKATSKSRGD
jgi:hypothetical protein